MILDAVLKHEGLFEPDGLAAELKALGHRASRATVYRTLGHLQDAGILKQVFFDNRQGYYEVIVGRRTHDHLICVETGEVIEFDSGKLRQLRDAICAEHGFDPAQPPVPHLRPQPARPPGRARKGRSAGGGRLSTGRRRWRRRAVGCGPSPARTPAPATPRRRRRSATGRRVVGRRASRSQSDTHSPLVQSPARRRQGGRGAAGRRGRLSGHLQQSPHPRVSGVTESPSNGPKWHGPTGSGLERSLRAHLIARRR